MQINVQQLNEMRQNGDDHLLLDVREPNELDICSIQRHSNHSNDANSTAI